MTIPAVPSIKNGCLMVRGGVILTQVPENVVVTPISHEAAFIGACSETPSAHLVFQLGVLEGYKFVCLFRFKMWWMIPSFGESGCDVPTETQMLLLEAREASEDSDVPVGISESKTGKTFYLVVLPVLDGNFRATLQGTTVNELEFCAESGDPNVQTYRVLEAVFMNSGDNPYKLMRNSIEILEKHKGTFSHIENKMMPKHIDWFGWSTWDAFYIDVSAQGITEGLKSFSSGGYSPKFLIIDDGWQNTVIERQEDGEMPTNSAKLVNCEENDKFKGFFSEICCSDLSLFIKHVKEKYGVRVVYAWHALIGYWGGVLPTSPVMGKYNPRIVYPIQSPGNLSNIVCGTIDPMEKEGIGFIEPSRIREFYEDLHGYLASCSVDGVKVDVQNILETLGSGYGGRVALIRQYQEALEESVIKNFRANNLICSMSMNTERIYSSKRGAAARVSEDFMPNEPTFQTLHVAAVAFNSLLLGEIVVPDWDMFYSNHYTADFHGAARALGGCAVYVSDKPGQHNFDIIKKLVLPDGSILRARYAGRPTRDCLFIDPVTDNKSLLKIWNMNKFSGIIGVFNCQRSGKWPPIAGAQWLASPESDTVVMSGYISSMDVDFLEEAADESWCGDCALYLFKSGSLLTMPKEASFEVSLGVLKFEIFTVSPIRVVGQSLKFAPIGLVDMYNSGAAVQYFECRDNLSNSVVKLQVRGCGRFGAYSNKKPRSCSVDLQEEIFTYNAKDGLLIFNLGGQCSKRDVEIMY